MNIDFPTQFPLLLHPQRIHAQNREKINRIQVINVYFNGKLGT